MALLKKNKLSVIQRSRTSVRHKKKKNGKGRNYPKTDTGFSIIRQPHSKSYYNSMLYVQNARGKK